METMKKLIILFFLLLLLGLIVEQAQAQEILKDKYRVIPDYTCQVDKQYVMGKDKPDNRRCIFYVDEKSENGWALIFDKYGKPAVVVEFNVNEGVDGQRIVWRRGQVSL